MVVLDSQEDWSPVGTHRYRFEAPDIFFIRFAGDVSHADTVTLFDRLEALSMKVGRPIFWVSDIGGLGQVNQDARKVPLTRDSTPFLQGTAIFGGSFHQRLMANLVMKAIPILRPNRPVSPLWFCATEAEARAFVEEERRRQGPSS